MRSPDAALNTAGQSGCSDTVLVDAAAGLISSTPVMMAPVVWLKGAVSASARLVWGVSKWPSGS